MSRIKTSEEEDATAQVPSETDSVGSFLRTRLCTFEKIHLLSIKSLNAVVVALSMTGCLIDSLFYYTDVIYDKEKCILFDKSLAIVVCVLRTVNDFGYVIYFYRLAKQCGSFRNLFQDGWTRLLFVISVLSITPLPQVSLAIILIFPGSIGVTGNQFLGLHKGFRLLPVIIWTLIKISTGNFAEWIVMFSFYTMYFSQSAGIWWYALAIKEEIACWDEACSKIHTNCSLPRSKYFCSQGFKADQSVHKFCSRNTTEYGFGMLSGVHQSGVLLDTYGHSWKRILYGFTWGLQNLSSFGQNLEAGGHVGRNFLLIAIIVFGMLLFSFLIGIFQMIMKSYGKKSAAREKTLQDIQKWQPFQNLSQGLQQRIEKYTLRNNWQETNVVNLEHMFNTLPKSLRGELTRELCLRMIKTVEEFGSWTDASLEDLYNCLKPVYFVQRTCIIKEGDPIYEMVFVVRGMLWTNTKAVSLNINDRRRNSTNDYLGEDDFYGKELLNWIQADSDTSDLPISPNTLQAVTNVEAFVLMAFDLKMLIKHEEATMARLFENEFPGEGLFHS